MGTIPKVLAIGGCAAVGKTTVAVALGARLGSDMLPLDTIWLALRAATSPASHPELHDLDPSGGELTLERLRDHHTKGAQTISRAMDPVIEYYLREGQPVVMEGAWIAPSVAARWTRDHEDVQAVFIHEPDMDEILATMLARSGNQVPTPRVKMICEGSWLVGNRVREEALAVGLPVVDARPRGTLAKRVLAAIGSG
jgi:2-phosphoglycerate kinase